MSVGTHSRTRPPISNRLSDHDGGCDYVVDCLLWSNDLPMWHRLGTELGTDRDFPYAVLEYIEHAHRIYRHRPSYGFCDHDDADAYHLGSSSTTAKEAWRTESVHGCTFVGHFISSPFLYRPSEIY